MWSPVWLIVLPLLMAFVSVVIKKQQYLLLNLSIILNLAVLYLSPQGMVIIGGFRPPFGISLNFDRYAFISLLLIQVLMLFATFIAGPLAKKYGTVLLVLLAGINGMLLTNDLFNLFVMIEVVSIASFIISTSNGKFTHTFHYLILASVGGVFFLLGAVMVYAYTGTLVVQGLFATLGQLPNAISLIPMMLIILGLAVELKLMPVGSWAKNIYGNANVLTGPIFAAVLAPAFGFVFGRMMGEVVVLNPITGYTLLFMAIATFVLGELAAYRQKDLLKTLAFSSIAQSGLAIILFTLNLPFAAILLLINNALAKSILFWVATGVSTAYETSSMKGLRGVFYNHRILGITFSIASLSLVGIPLFLGFYAKVTAVMAIFTTGLIWIPVVILATAIIEGAYMMKWLLQLWSPAKEGHLASIEEVPEKREALNMTQIVAVCLVALILFVFGLVPQRVGRVLSVASQAEISQVETVAEGGEQ